MPDEAPPPTTSDALDNIFADDPILGAYVSHHPSNRLWLLVQGAVAYGVPVALLNVLFPDVTFLGALALIGTFAAWGLLVGWWVLHRWNREVIVYERGFTYQEGSRLIYINYAEITQFRQQAERVAYLGLIRQERYVFDLTTRKGEHLRLNNLYRRPGRLGRLLERGLLQYRLPVLQAQLAAGETVPLGDDLALSPDGLMNGERRLPWAQFAGHVVKDGHLILKAADDPDWLRVPLAEVDNLLLLVALLKTARPAADASQAHAPDEHDQQRVQRAQHEEKTRS